VLPKGEFDEQHVPGAIHIPLRKIDPGVEEMVKVMATRDLPNVPVTTSAGELIGLLVREDVERTVHER
jgi:hypothetical protein